MVIHVDQISTPPTPADSPSVFEERAAKVWSDLARAVPQLNQQADEIEAIGQAADAAKLAAQADSDAAMGFRNEANAANTLAQSAAVSAGAGKDGAEEAKRVAEEAADRALTAAADAENRVPMTSATGAALLPEGIDIQRPTGAIPAGALLLRGSTQDPADYKPEFWNRVAAAWQALASRPWVSALTNTLGLRITELEAVKNTPSGTAPYFGCRAWVRFDGVGTPKVLASGGVLGVQSNGTGDYSVLLATPMPTANPAVIATGSNLYSFSQSSMPTLKRESPGDTSRVNIVAKSTAAAGCFDDPHVCVSIFY